MTETIKITTGDGRIYEFELEESASASFAGLILDGHSSWVIDVSDVEFESGQSASSERTFLIQGWLGVSENVLKYLPTVSLRQVINTLEKTGNPGNVLDELIHS